jgi:exosortase family protein XrtG
MFKILLLLIFIYLLTIFKRKKLDFFYFLFGSIGLFLIVLFCFKDLIIIGMIKFTTMYMGVIGELTNGWVGYADYGVLFVDNGLETISLSIDYECSGFIETLVYGSLSLFFPVFSFLQRIKNQAIHRIRIYAQKTC